MRTCTGSAVEARVQVLGRVSPDIGVRERVRAAEGAAPREDLKTENPFQADPSKKQ